MRDKGRGEGEKWRLSAPLAEQTFSGGLLDLAAFPDFDRLVHTPRHDERMVLVEI